MMYDNTGGLRPAPNQESFNNIVYSTQNIIGKALQSKLTVDDTELYRQHNILNTDENGLYKPKNSHDNLFYKLIGSKVLSLGYERNMSLSGAIRASLFRPWDWILFGFLLGGPVIKNLCKCLLFIPCIFIIISAKKKEKIRPKFWQRWKLIIGEKDLLKVEVYPTKTVKTWLDMDGDIVQTRHMQNDGKHLALFKLFAFKKMNFMLAITAKICHNIYVKRYGKEYAYQIMKNYYEYQQHPNIEIYKGVEDLLIK